MPIKQFKSFGQFLEAAIKTVVITYGRFNPPTIGHGVLLDKLASIASTNKCTYILPKSETEVGIIRPSCYLKNFGNKPRRCVGTEDRDSHKRSYAIQLLSPIIDDIKIIIFN